MGLVLSAASVRGWTTDSGMEGPSVPAAAEAGSSIENISTFPWSLFTKSPRRRMRVAFTCNVCGQRTTRAINPHAYTDGTVFVQVIFYPSSSWLMPKENGKNKNFFYFSQNENNWTEYCNMQDSIQMGFCFLIF